MHREPVAPGLAAVTVNEALPAASSDSATVPAASALPAFAVVAENAAHVPNAAHATRITPVVTTRPPLERITERSEIAR